MMNVNSVMDKVNFCKCFNALREYSAWENNMYKNGLDFAYTPVSNIAEKLQLAMCGFNLDWSYDKKLEFDWIIEWAFNPDSYASQIRHGREWLLNTPENLYDFLVFMNERGWEEA